MKFVFILLVVLTSKAFADQPVLTCKFNFSSVRELQVVAKERTYVATLSFWDTSVTFTAVVSPQSVSSRNYEITIPRKSVLRLVWGAKSGWFASEQTGSFKESGLVDCR